MKRGMASSLTWFAWVMPFLCSGLAILFAIPPGGESVTYVVGFTLVFVIPFCSVGALIISRYPRHAIGWVAWWIGMATGISLFGVSYGMYDTSLPAALSIWGVSDVIWIVTPALAVTLLPLLFPTGRPPTARWRWVIWASIAGVAVVLTLFIAEAWLQRDKLPGDAVDEGSLPGFDLIFLSGLAIVVVAAIASVASLIVRYRRSVGVERQQLKWFTFSIVVTALVSANLVIPSPLQNDTADHVGASVFPFVPVAIAIAILRYRLYDIDRIINRTIVYGLLSALLLGIYFGLVLGLETLVRESTGESSPVVVAASTLVVAGLFRPLRSRIQGIVDRRFYRQKYDAVRTLEAFGIQLRDEVDLSALASDLQAVVQETMQPAHVSLWLRPSQ